MKLVVGTESTWSLRSIISGYLSGFNFEIELVNLSTPDYKNKIGKYSPVGLVPVLVTESVIIHDSLAISEYFNEISDGALYPKSENLRAISRSFCAELHSGFQNLRSECPFSLNEVEPLTNRSSNILSEISRVEEIFAQARLPYMFDEPGIIDAFYSALAYRLKIYGISLSGDAGKYQQSLSNWPLLKKAIGELNI